MPNTKPLSPQHRERRRLLADALRSGEYKRAGGTLQDGRSKPAYCCLGAGCRVAEKHGLEIDTDSSGGLIGGLLSTDGFSRYVNVARWYGFTVAEQRELARRNDAEEPWEAIAEAIELGTYR